MKTVFAYFFLVYFTIGSAFPGGDFAQLTHLPKAVQHFQLHQSEARAQGEHFSILTFIYDHYTNPDSHDHNDGQSHEDLPVKHLHTPLSLIVAQLVLLEHKIFVPYSTVQLDKSQDLLSSDYTKGVYHPPA